MKKKKKKRNVKQLFLKGIFFTVSGIIGFAGLELIDAIPNFSFWDILLALAVFAVSFPLHILLHELGHLIAGLVSGYQFIMFRFLNWVWIKTEQGISRRKQVVPGLLGQALMLPPENMDEPPMVLYHSGGLIVNLLTALLLMFLGVGSSNPRVTFYSLISAGVAFLLFYSNSYPRRGTDGYNLMQIRKRPEALTEVTAVLRLYGGMVQGEPFVNLQRHIPQHLPNTFGNPNTVTLYTAQAAVYFEKGHFEKARDLYETLWLNRKQLIHLHKPEVYLSYLFALLLTDPSHPDVEHIKNTQTYKNMIEMKAADSYKIHAAEAIYLDQDYEKAKHLLSIGKPLIATAPTVTEEKLEAQFYAYLRDEIRRFEKEQQLP